MIYIGVDPGKLGAIAIISEDGTKYDVIDMPLIGKLIDINELSRIFKKYINKDVFVVCEKCQYTPKIKSKLSAFSFGRNVAIIETLLIILGFKHELVRPQKWKKEFELINKDKQASVAKARQLFPELIKQLLISKDGRSESLLIAEYGRRYF